MSLDLPFSEEEIRNIIKDHPTPLHLYDETGLRETARSLNGAFDWSPGYVNHFAVKATPNPYILEILKDEDMGTDASSLPELLLSEAVGFPGEKIMFTSNNTPPEEYQKAYELGAVINLDDVNQIDVLRDALGGKFPELISFRYNPGPDRVTEKSNVIGNPEDAKFGVTTAQLPEAYVRTRELGATRFGLHTMVASNEPDEAAHIQTAEMLFRMAKKIYEEKGIRIEFVNMGGGIGPEYKPDQRLVDLDAMKAGIKQKYDELIAGTDLDPLRIIGENGRFVMAPNGYLVTTVRNLKDTYKKYVGVDATMADLMRPGMYDSYHHITVLGKDGAKILPQAVVGSLCENNDYFTGSETKVRELPEMEPGDIVIIHTTGAHGHAMGFNYNGKLRHAELLRRQDGTIQQIRRSETLEDLFSTLNYPGLL